MPEFPPKPQAPSVRDALRPAAGRFTKARQREVVRDILAKIQLPATLQAEWRERYGIEDENADETSKPGPV